MNLNLLFTAWLFVVFASPALAQKLKIEEVPQAVITGFHHHIPGVTPLSWELKNDDYEVGFKKDSRTAEAIFNAEGKWLRTETDLNEGGVPKIAFITIKRKFRSYRVAEIDRVEKPNEQFYKIELKRGKDDEITVYFDLEGKLTKVDSKDNKKK